MTPWPRLHLGPRLDASSAERILARARRSDPTYGPVGALLGPEPPPADLDVRRVLGTGRDVFDRAVASLARLDPQRAVFDVWPDDAVAEVGATVVVVLRLGPVTLPAVDRVVAVVDEPDRWGFAYGTLPGHPELGEEAFVVTLAEDGTVTARITARADVALPGGRLLRPLVHPVQRWAARRYLDALEDASRCP